MYSLNKIKTSILNESGIRIPKGTKAVKLLCHSDLDGVFSGILTFNQLVKQGINPSNIDIHLVQYGMYGDEAEKLLSKHGKQMVAVVDFAGFPSEVPGKKPDGSIDYNKTKKLEPADFVSDHHQDTPDAAGKTRLTKGKSGAIGKTEFKSDTEHLAVSYAQNLATPETIKAISNIDSAHYKDAEGKSTLLDTLNLPKNFSAKGRMDRLANITNTLLSQLIKSNETAVKQIIKTTPPSLASLYSSVLKFSKLHGKQVEIYNELTSGKPDMSKIDTLRKEVSSVSKEMTKETGIDNKKTKIEDLDQLRKRGVEDIENAKKGYWSRQKEETLKKAEKKSEEEKNLKAEKKEKTGNFTFMGNIALQDGGKAGRYVSSIISKDGKRAAAVIKKWPFMIQIALNPDFPSSVKKPDLGAMAREALKTVRNRYEKKDWPGKDSWAWDIVFKESGGHSAITNISGIGTLKILVGENKKRLKELENYKERIGGLTKMRAKMPNKVAEMDKYKEMKEKLSEERSEIIRDLVREFLIIWKKQGFGDVWVEPLKNQENYNIKENWHNKVFQLLK